MLPSLVFFLLGCLLFASGFVLVFKPDEYRKVLVQVEKPLSWLVLSATRLFLGLALLLFAAPYVERPGLATLVSGVAIIVGAIGLVVSRETAKNFIGWLADPASKGLGALGTISIVLGGACLLAVIA